jgi:hypothetical protein
MFERSPSACLTATAKICARCTWTAQGPGHGVGPQPKRYGARPCVSGPRNSRLRCNVWPPRVGRSWASPANSASPARWSAAPSSPTPRPTGSTRSDRVGPTPLSRTGAGAGPRAVGTPCNAGARSASRATQRRVDKYPAGPRTDVSATCRRQRWTDHGRFHDRPKRMRCVRGCRRRHRASSSSCPSPDAHPERHAGRHTAAADVADLLDDVCLVSLTQ